MFALIVDILAATRLINSNLRTLRYLERLSDGYLGGNNVVVLRVRRDGKEYAMRCYRRSKPYLRELYGEAYYPNELNVGGVYTPRYVDVVFVEWIEGRSLMKEVEEALQRGDSRRVHSLARLFDRLALDLIDAEWAHGDLTPDNIIVGADGELKLVDLDARYIPQLKGQRSCELGTRPYQSPRRGAEDFHPRIDDFSIGIISCSLHALALDTTLKERFKNVDALLIDGERVDDEKYPLMQHLLELFASSGQFKQYRVLKRLSLNELVIDALPSLLSDNNLSTQPLELFISWGLCGYCDAASGEVVILPLFDEGFEFYGDYALVRVMKWWFYIDKGGSVVESCGVWERGKPPKKRVKL